MRITVLGGCGVWPAAGQACSGYLVEHDGFRLLIDPGYATLPWLLERIAAPEVDAVLVSHGHPDHCADLHPLLRARAFGDAPAPRLPVHALPGAVDRVLALDGTVRDAYAVREFAAGDRFEVGPFGVDTWQLPHSRPNAGLRLAAAGWVLAYTGDTGRAPRSLIWPAAPTCSSPRRPTPRRSRRTPPRTCRAPGRPARSPPGRASGGCCSRTCSPARYRWAPRPRPAAPTAGRSRSPAAAWSPNSGDTDGEGPSRRSGPGSGGGLGGMSAESRG